MKILLVDDDRDGRSAAEREFVRLGHVVTVAEDGAKALEAYIRERPDLVVTGVFMPGMDGFALTRAVQRRAAPRWQPVLFLFNQRDDSLMAQAFEAGAEGLLFKPVSTALAEARLKAIARLLALQRQEEERSGELERYYAAELEEKRIAEHLVQRLVNADKLNDPAIQYWISAAASFSGDLVAAARTPGNVLHVLLADATGRGLAASINVLPIVAPFYRMTEKGFGIDAIVREMNTKVRQFVPEGRFVAVTVAAIDFREGYVRVWNGGNPGPFMLDAAGQVAHEFASRHLPLGVMDDADFDATTETHAFGADAQLVVYSDGMIKAENEADEAFGFARLKTALAQGLPQRRLDGVVNAVSAHVAGRAARDDISLMLVTCRQETEGAAEPSQLVPRPAVPPVPGNWRFGLRLGAAEVRKIDVVPLLLELANQFDGTRERSGELFVVLSELFNNALDHGLLRLDSKQKLGPEGMERYLDERRERLTALTSGEIELEIEQFELGGDNWLRIVCRDSGPGFDHAVHVQERADASLLPFGRGLALVRSMSASFEFNEAGNAVTAIMALTCRNADGSPTF